MIIGYKVNMQVYENQFYFYILATNENETIKIPFIRALKNIKYIGLHLTDNAEVLH